MRVNLFVLILLFFSASFCWADAVPLADIPEYSGSATSADSFIMYDNGVLRKRSFTGSTSQFLSGAGGFEDINPLSFKIEDFAIDGSGEVSLLGGNGSSAPITLLAVPYSDVACTDNGYYSNELYLCIDGFYTQSITSIIYANLTPVQYALTFSDPGNLDVISSTIASLDCGDGATDCTADLAEDAVVSDILYTAASGRTFSGWTGDLSGTTNPESLIMTQPWSVGGASTLDASAIFTETFEAVGYDLAGWTVTDTGGTVNPDYTTPALSGTRSLYLSEDTADVSISRSLGASYSVVSAGPIKLRIPTPPASNITGRPFIQFTNDSFDNLCNAAFTYTAPDISLRATLGANAATVNTSTFLSSDTMSVWVDYNMSNNTCEVFAASNDTKPAVDSAGYSCAGTGCASGTGTISTQATKFIIVSDYPSAVMLFDNLIAGE